MNEKDINEKFEKIWRKIKEIEDKLGIRQVIQSPNRDESPRQKIDVNRFCSDIKISEDNLRSKIDFQEEMPRLMSLPKEKTRTKTQYLSLMILGLLYKKIYAGTIENKKIVELFQFSRVPTERMDKLYDSSIFKRFFTKVSNEIRFSWAGEKEAEKLITELVENETNTTK